MQRVDLMMRSDCNINCPFCYQDIFQRAAGEFDFSYGRLQSALRQGRRYGYQEVYISGGEPTISKDLGDIVAYARSLGYQRVKVMTNGIRLASRAYVDALAAAGLTGLAFSLHGHTKAVHNLHTGNERSFDRLVAGLKDVISRHSEVDVEVNTVVTRHNIDSLVELARLVSSLGVRELHLQHVVPSSPQIKELVPAPAQVKAGLRRVIHCRPDALHLSLAFVPYCWLRGYEQYIPRFDFTTPFFSNCPAMFEGWQEALLAAKVLTEECRGCPDFDHCRGFWQTG